MIQKELLVPVGSMEHLDFAIHNGCDAVYLGGKRFGARAYANNFSEEEIIAAIRKCHVYGVKIYVTVNTMIFERERKQALEYVNFLTQNQVDAVIVSDIGLLRDIHKQNPHLAIHVSTQAHTSTAGQMKLLKSLGATRVVLDREMSLEEINKLPNILEKEIFIHGALCVSFSGECLISGLNEVRSGNRGTCAQYCRMKYRLLYQDTPVEKDVSFLLSTKELNTSNHIKELMESNVLSFKIEGRMKSKEYVGFITKYYRKRMDSYRKKQELLANPEEEKKIKSLFHREFTDGYLFNEENIMNFKTANHIGIPLGKVLEATKDKIKIKLCEDIKQEDGIRFLPSDTGQYVNFLYNEKGKYINQAKKNEIIFVDNKVGLKNQEVVRKTIDHNLLEELNHYEEKKIPITMNIQITLNSFSLTLKDEENTVTVEKNIVEKANQRSTTKEEVMSKMNRLGNTPFSLKDYSMSMEDNLFIPIGKMNELRRIAVEMLIEKRCQK